MISAFQECKGLLQRFAYFNFSVRFVPNCKVMIAGWWNYESYEGSPFCCHGTDSGITQR